MAAQYPGAVKDFATNVDLSTEVNAAYMNERDEEIEAIQGAIGIRPWGGAYGMFQNLLNLRGFWPMSAFNENAHAIDFSSQSRNLTPNGGSPAGPTSNMLFAIPYAAFTTDQYFSRTSEAGLEITGTESWLADNALKGLTLGGWFYVTSLASAGYFIAKDDLSARSYGLYHQTDGSIRFGMFDSLSSYWEVVSSTNISINTWYFLVGRAAIGSGSRDVFINAVKTADTSLPPPTEISNAAADFCVGARSDATAFLNGNAALCFVCASALSDTVISTLFSQTRRRFGV